jgi:hypothetical protein
MNQILVCKLSLIVDPLVAAQRSNMTCTRVLVLGQRTFLLRNGWQSSRDNPIVLEDNGHGYCVNCKEGFGELVANMSRLSLSQTSQIELGCALLAHCHW